MGRGRKGREMGMCTRSGNRGRGGMDKEGEKRYEKDYGMREEGDARIEEGEGIGEVCNAG